MTVSLTKLRAVLDAYTTRDTETPSGPKLDANELQSVLSLVRDPGSTRIAPELVSTLATLYRGGESTFESAYVRATLKKALTDAGATDAVLGVPVARPIDGPVGTPLSEMPSMYAQVQSTRLTGTGRMGIETEDRTTPLTGELPIDIGFLAANAMGGQPVPTLKQVALYRQDESQRWVKVRDFEVPSALQGTRPGTGPDGVFSYQLVLALPPGVGLNPNGKFTLVGTYQTATQERFCVGSGLFTIPSGNNNF